MPLYEYECKRCGERFAPKVRGDTEIFRPTPGHLSPVWWPGGAPKHRGFPWLGFNPKNRINGSGFYATDPEGLGSTPATEDKPEEQKSPAEKKESSPKE